MVIDVIFSGVPFCPLWPHTRLHIQCLTFSILSQWNSNGRHRSCHMWPCVIYLIQSSQTNMEEPQTAELALLGLVSVAYWWMGIAGCLCIQDSANTCGSTKADWASAWLVLGSQTCVSVGTDTQKNVLRIYEKIWAFDLLDTTLCSCDETYICSCSQNTVYLSWHK